MKINGLLAGVAWVCALISLIQMFDISARMDTAGLFPFPQATWMALVVSEFLIGFILLTVGNDIENVEDSVRDAKKKIDLIDTRTRRMSDGEWFNKLEARLSQIERKMR